MSGPADPAGATTVRAVRIDADHVRLTVTGTDVEIVRSPLRIHPPQFDVVPRADGSTSATAVLDTPFPPDWDSVVVNLPDGSVRVAISDVSPSEPGSPPPT